MTLEGLTRSKRWARPHGRFGEAHLFLLSRPITACPPPQGVNSFRARSRQMDDRPISQRPVPRSLPSASTAMQTPDYPDDEESSASSTADFRDLRYAPITASAGGSMTITGIRLIGHRGGVDRATAHWSQFLTLRSASRNRHDVEQPAFTRPIGLQMEFLDQLYGQPRRDWLRLNEGS